MIIHSNREFRKEFHRLDNTYCIIGNLNLKRCEEHLLLDLVERGVTLFPPALSQQLSRSKCMQAAVYESLMVPDTKVIKSRHELISYISRTALPQDRQYITKQDRLDCGLGINMWTSLEEIFNAASFGGLEYPFVLQPYIADATDIRVIIIGDYMEAYWRKSHASFRNNLHFGGRSGAIELDDTQMSICRKAMKRGKFPYAHIDLLVTDDGESFLSEISLRGGIRGARISPDQYKRLVTGIQKKFADDFAALHSPHKAT